MASLPSDPRPVLGRVDRAGRLVAADPKLERLQLEAGSRMGAPLALPQLAAIARTVQRLRVPVSRRAVAAGRDQDIDMWVRASLAGEEVELVIEQWNARASTGPRLAAAPESEAVLPGEPSRWSVDQELRLTRISAALAETAGIDATGASGEPLTRLFRLEENEDGVMPLLAALAARSGFSGQRVKTREGESLLILDGEPVTGANGEFAGFDGTAKPPEAQEPQNAAPIVDAQLEHVLRSPLDRIIDSAARIAERTDGPLRSEYAVYAADISAAAHHLLSIVRSIGQDPATATGRAAIDLVELTNEAVGLVESAAAERDIAIAIEPTGSCAARGEPRGVIQILVNLIGNAVRHSPDRSAVAISFEKGDGCAVVHVSDNGPGIAANDQERIFERFEQASTDGQGTGLGLAIARRLARAMEGDIQLKSEPGKGSIFSLVLPAA
jgi:signal transduction histidine kinase